MPRNNDLGAIRRSQVVTTFGPGAIIDFNAGGPVSVVAAGLDAWDERAQPAGLLNPQTVFEPRLQDRLKVRGFRLPPVSPETRPGQSSYSAGTLVGVRFPRWLQCPECHVLKEAIKWSNDPGQPVCFCFECTSRQPAGKRISVGPVRFIMACENGHLDEFPWHWWVEHRETCRRSKPLKLKSEGSAGLAGLVLSCGDCGASRPMEGCFSEEAFKGFDCQGRRPWLPTDEPGCQVKPRAILRGASNLYFPVHASALSIPPWSERIQNALGVYWEDLRTTAAEDRPAFIRLNKLDEKVGMSAAELLDEVNTRIAILSDGRSKGLRFEEYLQLTRGDLVPLDRDVEFELRSEKVPAELTHWISGVARVTRLREVRALLAFTRIRPPATTDDDSQSQLAQIQSTQKDWLPATEVRGEGIFVRLNSETLKHWESLTAVASRAAVLDAKYKREWASRYGPDEKPNRTITPRLLLVHTLSHALMRQLSLECGYSAASLRERLYVDSGQREMAGLLVYTATSDADGTLGGLARQGEGARLLQLFEAAINSFAWCSSDPLCIQGLNSLSESLNLAACHSCLHAPETSCEEFNRLLDRATLVGAPNSPDVGFFRPLLDGVE